MGLFSFLKKAGSNIFKREDVEAKAAELKQQKIALLHKSVSDLGIEVNDFSLDLDDDTVVVYGQTKSQAEKEKVILALGNVEGIATVDDRISVVPPTPDAPPEPEAKFYEVQSGDSLSKIAKEFYGDPMKYTAIFEANQPMLKDPNLIYPGQTLRIPPL